jgi:hypothetical protein
MLHLAESFRQSLIRLAVLMATMVGLIVFAGDAARRLMWYGRRHGTGSRSVRRRGPFSSSP